MFRLFLTELSLYTLLVRLNVTWVIRRTEKLSGSLVGLFISFREYSQMPFSFPRYWLFQFHRPGWKNSFIHHKSKPHHQKPYPVPWAKPLILPHDWQVPRSALHTCDCCALQPLGPLCWAGDGGGARSSPSVPSFRQFWACALWT